MSVLIYISINYYYFQESCFWSASIGLRVETHYHFSSSSFARASQATRKTSSTVTHIIIVVVTTCLKTIRRVKILFYIRLEFFTLFTHTYTHSPLFFIYKETTIIKKIEKKIYCFSPFLHLILVVSYVTIIENRIHTIVLIVVVIMNEKYVIIRHQCLTVDIKIFIIYANIRSSICRISRRNRRVKAIY